MNAKGTGLGLSICKKIINQMGGDVNVQSQLSVGTRFNLTLQLKANDKELIYDELAAEEQSESNEQIEFTEGFSLKFAKIEYQRSKLDEALEIMQYIDSSKKMEQYQFIFQSSQGIKKDD